MEFIADLFLKVKSIFSKNHEKTIFYYLIFNVCWLFLGLFLHNYNFISYQGFSISLIFLFICNIIFIFTLCRSFRFDKIDVFLILLFLFGIISTIFSKNISVSLYGFWKRFEGLFQLLYYYSLMFLASNIYCEKYKKKIISFILFFAVINVLICFLQVFDILKFIPVGVRNNLSGMGLTLNTNFFGSYMVLCLCLCLGIFLYSKNNNIFSLGVRLVLCLFMYSGLLMSNAMSAMVGLMIVCLLIIGYYIFMCFKYKNIFYNFTRHIVLLISCLILSLFFTVSKKSLLFNDVVKFFGETTEMAKGNVNDSYGTSRIFIWKSTLKVVPRYLVHGVGIDNFYDAFDEPLFIKTSDTSIEYFDKAHNEYLQKLVCEGIFSCVTYIVMLLIIFYQSIKNVLLKGNCVTISLFLSFVAYSVQAFFNISVIHVAPIFFVVCGLLYERKCKV